MKDALGWTAIAQGNGFILQNNMEKSDPTLNADRYLTINGKGELKLTGSKGSAMVFSYDASAGTLSASVLFSTALCIRTTARSRTTPLPST